MFYIGTSGWSYDHWRGCFYEEGVAKSKWLEYYAERFNTVEVNATFYRSMSPTTYAKWREATPAHFRFTLKAPRLVTHVKKLVDAGEPLNRFVGEISALGEKLGCVLVQLAPTVPVDLGILEGFLKLLPQGLRVACEFRKDAWHTEATHALLATYNAALCIVSAPRLGS